MDNNREKPNWKAKRKAFKIPKSKIEDAKSIQYKESLGKFWECKNREEAKQYSKNCISGQLIAG